MLNLETENLTTEAFMLRLRGLYQGIISLDNYQPCLLVNELFSGLVEMAINPEVRHCFNSWEIARLQRACNLAEIVLEKYWAKRIITAADPRKEVEKFPYIRNYRQLTYLELGMLNLVQNLDFEQPVVFVGGGLPLTSYIMAKDYGISSTVLDIDEEAVDLGNRFVKKIGLESRLKMVNESGQNFPDYGQVVIVAALAGMETQQKEQIFRKIPQNSTIIARSVEEGSNRELLYKVLPKSVLGTRKTAVLVHPGQTEKYREVINSVAILKGV